MFRVVVEGHPEGRYAAYSRSTGELWARFDSVVAAALLIRGEQLRAQAQQERQNGQKRGRVA